MKKIKSANTVISTVLGKQKNDKENYHLSKHVFSIPCADGILYFHTLTEEIYLIEKNDSIERHKGELISERFFVPEGYDEEKLVNDVYTLLCSMNKKSDITSFTILTTTDCNARCYYCYEMGRKRIPMSEKVAYDVADYIVDKCGCKEVSLRWFGGEPLYNRKVIDIITNVLNDKHIKFHSQMVSNGYYLDEKTCIEAKEKWNLKKVQITLDGTKKKYQSVKAFIERDTNAFERVLDNIDSALNQGIYVTVRLNVDKSNVNDLHDLVTLLKDRYKNNANFHIYAALLRPFVGKIVAFDDELEELNAYKSLLKLINDAGIARINEFKNNVNVNYCMADNDSSEVILPDGRIGKCEHHSEDYLIGTIYSDVKDEEMIKAWKEIMPKYSECNGCPLYPRCRYLVKCDYTKKNCSTVDRMLKEYMIGNQILNEYKKYKNKEL